MRWFSRDPWRVWRRLCAASCWALCLGVAARAFADDALNSSARATNRAADEPGETRAHNVFNIVPIAGGSTDEGFGGGFFSGLARVEKGHDPYLWNIESAGFVTFKGRPGGGVMLPYQDYFVKLTIPKFFARGLRLEFRPSYTAERTVHYYGVGNASSATVPAQAPDAYLEYGRIHPQIEIDLRWSIVDHLIGRHGLRYVQNWIETTDNSKLRDDMRTGSDEVKRLLGGTAPHAVALFWYGLQWDDRDNEVSPHKGTFHTFLMRLSPGGSGMFPYRYAESTLAARVYIPLSMPRITLAGRLVGDVLFGDPPFYELARFSDTYAIGGTNGVRGVPAGRYYGKVKALGNVELRTEVVSFDALGKPLILGVTVFFDAGRVWADTSPHPELDGRGLGLKYGTGGGLRLQSGSSFVLRTDVAWSPDATPVGGYFCVGQIF